MRKREINFEKANRQGLQPIKMKVTRQGKVYMMTVYRRPDFTAEKIELKRKGEPAKVIVPKKDKSDKNTPSGYIVTFSPKQNKQAIEHLIRGK